MRGAWVLAPSGFGIVTQPNGNVVFTGEDWIRSKCNKFWKTVEG